MDDKCCNHNCNQGRDCPLRDVWTACLDCGKRVTSDSIHTCSPQFKELTDEEIWELHQEYIDEVPCGHSMQTVGFIEFARAILRKAQKK